jgi:hypothetical protein
MTRSHALTLSLRARREEAWEGKDQGGVRVLLSAGSSRARTV